jgi:HD-GYP domain-containing protein (c-di-GMP phosphodiesterase class II)
MVKFSDLKKSVSLDTNGQPGSKRRQDAVSKSSFSFSRIAGETETDNGAEKPDLPIEKEVIADHKSKSLYDDAKLYLRQAFDAARENRQFSLEHGFRLVENVVTRLKEDQSLYIQALHQDSLEHFLFEHNVNMTIYIIKMCENLGFKQKKQVEIGMAGLLHSLGMAQIPEPILFKKDKLTSSEFRILKSSPEKGHAILKAQEKKHDWLAVSALQAFERVNGIGYPYGLKGNAIHEYAQIIGLASVYEALTHRRPFRDRLSYLTAVKEILQKNKNAFIKTHLKAFLNTFSIFPLFSYVKLNSGAIGQVIETYPDQPMRPKLMILFDSKNNPVSEERIIDLPQHSLLYVVDSVAASDLNASPIT